MASETVLSHQIPNTDEQVEKKMSEEEKAAEQNGVSSTKESGEEIPKTEDSTSPVTLSNSEGIDYKKIDPPVVESEKTADAPVSDVPLIDQTKVENDPIPDSKASEQVVDTVIESAVGEEPKEPAIETIEKGKEEQPKLVDVPQSSVEAIEKPEESLEVTSDKGSIKKVLQEIKGSELESLDVQKQELAVAEVEEKPGDPSELTQHVEKKHEVEPEEHVQDEMVKDEESAADKKVEHTTFLEEGKTETDDTPSLEVKEEPEQPKLTEQEKKHDEVEAEKSVEEERVKDEGSSADKVEDSTFLEEGQTADANNKPSQIISLEEVSHNREAQIELQDGADSSLPDVTEKLTAAEDQKKELSEDDVVEKLAEEAAEKIEKVGVENVETEEIEKRNFVTEDSTEPIKKEQKTELSVADVVEKIAAVDTEEAGEENVEIEEKEKRIGVTEYSTQPIKEDRKELCGPDVVQKIAEEETVELVKVGEKNVETEEDEKGDAITEDSIQPIIEDHKKELSAADVIEKVEEEAVVKLEKVGEENVAKNVETEENEKRNVIAEDSIQPIQEDRKKESSGIDVVEKLAKEAAVKLEKVGEESVTKNVETEENEKIDVIAGDSTQPVKEDQKKELSEVDVVKKLAEETAVEVGKVGEENETKNVKSKDNGNRNVIDEVSIQPDKEDVNSSISPSTFIEKSFEGVGKDVEPVVGNERAEHIKDEMPAIVETKNDENAEENQGEVTAAVNEPLKESKQYESEVKGEETVKTDADKLEKVVDNVAKSDQNVESSPKDGDYTKPSDDLLNEVSAKLPQKQSNNILSKVKQSLVKAKKAITGKSPSSKTPTSGTKGDIKVK